MSSIISEAGLRLKHLQFKFSHCRVQFLGHIGSREEMRVDPERMREISDALVSHSKTGLQNFLGLVSYFRPFIQEFAKSAAASHETPLWEVVVSIEMIK